MMQLNKPRRERQQEEEKGTKASDLPAAKGQKKAHGRQAFASTLQAEDDSEVQCGVVSYQAKNILPENAANAGVQVPLVIGKSDNIDPLLSSLGIDLTGLWWMRDSPLPQEVVSFAGSVVTPSYDDETGAPTFPANLAVFNGRSGTRAWTENPAGQVLLGFAANYDPEKPIAFRFLSDITGEYVPEPNETISPFFTDEFAFIYQNADEWVRSSEFIDNLPVPNTYYTMTRIVMADGSPHPTYWPLFMDYMVSTPWWGDGHPGEKHLVSFMSDNTCMRTCQLVMPCRTCRDVFCTSSS